MMTDTYREIIQQPAVWKKSVESFHSKRTEILSFVLKHFESSDSEIILTGAGSSAFIGSAISGLFVKNGYRCRAVATTDLVTHPELYLYKEKQTLLISFARSGNSPESLAAVHEANRYCQRIAHIFVTCNADGALAKNCFDTDTYVFLLPAETNDKSLAMTSSFTSMMLTGILLSRLNTTTDYIKEVEAVADITASIINQYEPLVQSIADRTFERAVFLGSGVAHGLAEECHLKLQELTDGKVICKFDSFLGFRHGPKAVVNSSTLLVYLFSSDEKVLRYERDLAIQVNRNNRLAGQIAIKPEGFVIPEVNFDLCVNYPDDFKGNDYLNLLYVVVAQLLAYHKSLNLGFNPDSPSVSGNISRVVEGVIIYE